LEPADDARLDLRGLSLEQAQRSAAKALAAAGIEEPLLEAEVLLRHVLGLDRAAFFSRLDEPLDEAAARSYEGALARRLAREPTAYITGHKEFYGLDLAVSPDALIPRPETELLVERALAAIEADAAPLVVDVGAGCGAIAVALAVNHPGVRVVAVDVSRPALALAARNAKAFGVAARVAAVQGDLLACIGGACRVIVANLPYVRSGDWDALAPEIRLNEPRLALDGGPDGLAVIRRLLEQAAPFVEKGCLLLAEIGDDQGAAAAAAARAAMPAARVSVEPDAAGRDRMLVVSA